VAVRLALFKNRNWTCAPDTHRLAGPSSGGCQFVPLSLTRFGGVSGKLRAIHYSGGCQPRVGGRTGTKSRPRSEIGKPGQMADMR